MKKQLLALALLLMGSSLAFGQFKPEKGDFGISFQFIGLENIGFNNFSEGSLEIPQLLARYYVNEKLAIRTTFGIKSNGYKREHSNTVLVENNTQISDTAIVASESNFSFAIAPGIEYHVPVVTERLDAYVGGFIPLEIVTQTTSEEDSDIHTREIATGNNVYRQSLNTKTNSGGGFAIGAGLLIGFNYFFAKKFSIGAEYSLAYMSKKVGGDVNVGVTGFVQVGNNTTDINQTQDFKESETNSGFDTQSTAGIIASFFF